MFGLFKDRPGRRSVRRLFVEELESRTVPAILTPAQVRHAYGFDQVAFNASGQTVAADGSGQTIAIVDAFDDPNALADLQHFDQTFHLPDPPSFTTATPQGQPATDPGWSQEIALDVEWAHALAPGARLMLVEAASDSLADLLGAVDYARHQPGVVAVSMSWGAGEFPNETAYDGYFTTPAGHVGGSSGLPGATNLPGGVTFVAASGDDGAAPGAEWPAASPNVLAVGGTTLSTGFGGAYLGESAWSGGGGGTSSFEPEPAYQAGVQSSGQRTVPDVAYAADPNTAFYVYDSVPVDGYSGWYAIGGTSAGAPQWAALVAIADQGRALAGQGSLDGPNQTLYALYQMAGSSATTYFHDVTTGNNGYAAGPGYDLATGLGTPYAQQVISALVSANGSGNNLNINGSATAVQDAITVNNPLVPGSPQTPPTNTNVGSTSGSTSPTPPAGTPVADTPPPVDNSFEDLLTSIVLAQHHHHHHPAPHHHHPAPHHHHHTVIVTPPPVS